MLSNAKEPWSSTPSSPNTCPEGGCHGFFFGCFRRPRGTMVNQRGPTAMERLARAGRIRRGALLPTPAADAAPRKCQRAHGRLRRCPLRALLRGIDPRPEGLPDRCGGPLAERLPAERWTWAAPVPPGLLAAAFGDRRDPRLLLPCGGGRALPWCAEGDEQPGAKTGPAPGRAWNRGQSGWF
jgi:hypothetical protein